MAQKASHGACGAVWTQHGEKTSHCGDCHVTYATLTLFDKHRKDGVCFGPTPDLVCDVEGVWWTPEGLENLYRLQEEGKKRFRRGADDE